MIEFSVERLLPDSEDVFVMGDIYSVTITKMDFEFCGDECMTVHIKNNDVDIEGLWSVKDFKKEFSIKVIANEQA